MRAFFRGAAREFDQAGGHEGCAIGAVTLDLGADDLELRRLCEEVFESWIATIASHVPGPDRRRRRRFAEMVLTTLEGAFVLGRARASGEPFVTAGDWLAVAAASFE